MVRFTLSDSSLLLLLYKWLKTLAKYITASENIWQNSFLFSILFLSQLLPYSRQLVGLIKITKILKKSEI